MIPPHDPPPHAPLRIVRTQRQATPHARLVPKQLHHPRLPAPTLAIRPRRHPPPRSRSRQVAKLIRMPSNHHRTPRLPRSQVQPARLSHPKPAPMRHHKTHRPRSCSELGRPHRLFTARCIDIHRPPKQPIVIAARPTPNQALRKRPARATHPAHRASRRHHTPRLIDQHTHRRAPQPRLRRIREPLMQPGRRCPAQGSLRAQGRLPECPPSPLKPDRSSLLPVRVWSHSDRISEIRSLFKCSSNPASESRRHQ